MDLSNGTVLVVDDFATMRGILASLLHEVGFCMIVQTVRRSPKHKRLPFLRIPAQAHKANIIHAAQH
ncbi:MAG: hypothetical protein ACOYNF_11585 [Rhodoferax sp.]